VAIKVRPSIQVTIGQVTIEAGAAERRESDAKRRIGISR
jgi:hypothetical protein